MEGFEAKPYLCPAGVPTIGWGTTRYPGGRAVTLADPPVSQAQAEAFLQGAMRDFLGALMTNGSLTRAPTVNQAAALLCLACNIGIAALAGSTLLARFNAGDLPGAADQFLDWNKAHVNGALTVLPGLAARRAREKALFETPDLAENIA